MLLLDLKRRGFAIGPELAVADGALGFWQAIEEVWPQTRGQRCWVHKTANVLNKLLKNQQSKAKRALQEIWMAETKNDTLVAFDAFVETWSVKYDKAVECLIKDRGALFAFYDFPAGTGNICVRPTSSKAHSRPCVTAPCARRDVSRTRPRWR
jgi:putative transposase